MLLNSDPVDFHRAIMMQIYRSLDSREILGRALDALQKGWTKGAFTAQDGSVCILGGMNQACGTLPHEGVAQDHRNRPGFDDALDHLRLALLELAEERGLGNEAHIAELRRNGHLQPGVVESIIPWFNDRVETTYEDVAMLMKRAIHHAEEDSS